LRLEQSRQQEIDYRVEVDMPKTKNEIVMIMARLNHSRPAGTPKIELTIIGGNIYGLDIIKLDNELQAYLGLVGDNEISCIKACVKVYGRDIACKIKEYLNISNLSA
jgi:hypothetical protein